MAEEHIILTTELYSAAMQVLTKTPLSDPEKYSYLLGAKGRLEAKRIQQMWVASDRARLINPGESRERSNREEDRRRDDAAALGRDGSGST